MAIVRSSELNITLEARSLGAFTRAVAAGCPRDVNSSWRDPEIQRELFEDSYTSDFGASAKFDQRTWNGVPHWRRVAKRSGGPTVSVAVPGTSLHEDGLALDLGEQSRVWMAAHPTFGWINPAWAKSASTLEPWHYEYSATADAHEEDDMPLTKEDLAALRALIREEVPGAVWSAEYELTDFERSVLDLDWKSVSSGYLQRRGGIASVRAASAAFQAQKSAQRSQAIATASKAVVDKLKAEGVEVDTTAIEKIIKKALDDIEVTVNVETGKK
ncbi:M15 family metallopeptidase [Demequina silvatica]|uniref:M15 family metallopeptidase n=1 Tax=Demequina silvatica TaxID=1638988 RepID=UPI000780AEFB|nr:M15 family metallopeptidase [Demequina silvatica]